MTPEEQLELVKRHYTLQSAGDHPAAEELLTDDFVITIPSSMPFGGVFRGKKAFRELIPLVAEMVAVTNMEFVATTVGDDYAVEIVEFTLAGDAAPVQVAEVNRFGEIKSARSAPSIPILPHGSPPLNAASRPGARLSNAVRTVSEGTRASFDQPSSSPPPSRRSADEPPLPVMGQATGTPGEC